MGWQQIGVVNIAVVDRAARAYMNDGRPPENGCAGIAEVVHWETMHGPAYSGWKPGDFSLIEDDPYQDA